MKILLDEKRINIIKNKTKMTKQQIISETVDLLEKLPQEKAEEVRDILVRYYENKDEEIFEKGFRKLIYESGSYDFLKEEKDEYTVNDLIKHYK